MDSSFYMLVDPTAAVVGQLSSFRNHTFHVPMDDTFVLNLAVPQSLWDITDRLFLRPKPYHGSHFSMVLAMAFDAKLGDMKLYAIVTCEIRRGTPHFRVYRQEEYKEATYLLFCSSNRERSVPWSDFAASHPEIASLNHLVDFPVGNERVEIKVDAPLVEVGGTDMFSLRFKLTRY